MLVWRETRTGLISTDERLPWPGTLDMGFQHVLAIFGATVVAPLIMGFDPNLAIFFSGIGTLIAPVAIILVAENTGHVKAVEAMTDRHLMPYLGRAFGGDGVATMIAGLGGGTGVTTYAENIGVMAMTRVYSTLIFVIAALVAIVLGLSPKFGALVGSIPTGVIGGVVTVLFGLIAITGARIWVTNHVDFSKGVNLFVAAIVLIVGAADYTLRIGDFELGGIGLGTFGAIILYQIFKNAPAAWTPRPPPTPCRSSTRASVHRPPSRRAEWSPASVRRAVVIYGARMPRSCRSSRPAGRKSRCASAQPRSDGWRGSTTPGDCPPRVAAHSPAGARAVGQRAASPADEHELFADDVPALRLSDSLFHYGLFRAKDLHAGMGALSRGAQRKLQLIELMAERANVLLVESKGGMRAEADKLGLAGLAAEVDAW